MKVCFLSIEVPKKIVVYNAPILGDTKSKN